MVALPDQVRNTTGDHPGLAATGPGDDEQGAFLVKNSLPLRIVEIGQNRIRADVSRS
jgi:hypothetical protein